MTKRPKNRGPIIADKRNQNLIDLTSYDGFRLYAFGRTACRYFYATTVYHKPWVCDAHRDESSPLAFPLRY